MIRAAVIGAGWYAAQNHIPALAARPDVTLDGVCRLGAAELERVRAHFGFAFASEDHAAVLARRPAIVVVASPHHLHHRHVADALASGAHVLCEKPMTLDPAHAYALVERARRADRHLLIANGHHYLPRLTEIRYLLTGGALGRIEHAACTFVSATRAVFSGEVGLRRWSTTFFRPDRATWQDPERGGGFAYGQLSHSIALLLWLTGLAPRSVAARTSGDPVDLADAAVIGCEGGAVVAVTGAAAMPEGSRPLLRLVVSGSEGVMTVDVDRDVAELRLNDGTVRSIEVAPDSWVYECTRPVDALVDLAQGRGENLSPGKIGAATVAVIDAMLRSARAQGTPVEITRRS